MTAAFRWVEAKVETGALPGAVLGIGSSRGAHDIRAFGTSGGRQVAVDDVYPLFSVTKPIVGLAILRAVERGLLSLDAPLGALVPELERHRGVLLRHLLTHTSGISEPPMDAVGGPRPALETAGSDFAPGTATRYSTLAFAAAGLMLEAATGEPLEEAVTRLAVDAGAPGLSFDPVAEPHDVVGAAENGLDYPRFQGFRHPGAGMYGRTADLLALGAHLLADDGVVVHPTTLAASLVPRTSGLPKLKPYPAERGQDWGLTWNLPHSDPGLLVTDLYGHAGWAGTEFWLYPGLDLCVVLLTNRAGLGDEYDGNELLNAAASGL